MASLLDIAPLKEVVAIRGVDVEVPGISAEGLVYLIQKFEDLRKLFAGKGQEIQLEDMLQQSPALIAAFLAAGCGLPGNTDAEAMARKLGTGDQLALMEAVWRLTFPRGLKDFLVALDRCADTLTGESGKVRAMMSPEPSKNVSQTDTQVPGNTPPVSSPGGENSGTAAA